MDKQIIKELIKKENAVIFELGCYDGTDTKELIEIFPDADIHGFEPDFKNIETIKKKIQHKNFLLFEGAVSSTNEPLEFYRSSYTTDEDWLCSGSIRKPKNHLYFWPHVKFKEKIIVKSTTLDSYCLENNIKIIDFLWADVQGAESDIILGGKETFKNVRYFYTEYGVNENYEGQIHYNQLLDLLGKDFAVLQNWPDPYTKGAGGGNVLLINKKLYIKDIAVK